MLSNAEPAHYTLSVNYEGLYLKQIQASLLARGNRSRSA